MKNKKLTTVILSITIIMVLSVGCGKSSTGGNHFSVTPPPGHILEIYTKEPTDIIKKGNMEEDKIITVIYTNYKGKTVIRKIIPKDIYFGHTDWYPEDQWLMTVYDVDKQAERIFAIKNIKSWSEDMSTKILTMDELKTMNGQPAYCLNYDVYGVIECSNEGQWEGIPFFVGIDHKDEAPVQFSYNIKSRNLKCCRVIPEILSNNLLTS